VRPKQFFVPASPHISAWLLKHKWHALRLLYNQCIFSRSRSVKNDALFVMPKPFLVPILPHIPAWSLKHHKWHSLLLLHSQWKFGRYRCRGENFTLESETIFHPYLALHCSMVTNTSFLAFCAHAQQSVQVWSKSLW
jgi:hypothetical protein